MGLCYYQSSLSDKSIIRGNLSNWLEFAVYRPETDEWDNTLNSFYADDVLISSSSSYTKITEDEATKLIKAMRQDPRFNQD